MHDITSRHFILISDGENICVIYFIRKMLQKPNHFPAYRNMHWYFWIGRVVHTANFAIARGRTILSTTIRHIRLSVKQASRVWFANHVTSGISSSAPQNRQSGHVRDDNALR